MLIAESRPRTLTWLHAGPLLYGDWGTSRLYVLGLAFLYTAHASVIYLAAIGLLMIAVAWAYTIICRCYPDGGGVYTAARQLSPTAAVVGSTLLLSGYIMTAAISVIEAFHYFGVPESITLPLAIIAIVLIGGVNYLGAKSAGRFAFVVAIAALVVSAVMAVACLPFFFKGIETIDFEYFTKHATPTEAWVSFTKICLALAGVEAVANMTGLMKKPVNKTSKRTIWPVTIEVVVLNMVFGIALAGLSFTVDGVSLADQHGPHQQLIDAGALSPEGIEQVETYTNASMKVIATESGTHFLGDTAGFVFGKIAGITFGLLLLSATNTAIMATVSVLFAMGQDRELPKGLTKLNYSGVPWVGLIVAVVIPIGVIAVEQDVTTLAKLYVLGVCGAITVTLGSSALNQDLDIGPKSRAAIIALAAFLLAVTLTIAVTQWVSTAFSGTLIAIALVTRGLLRSQATKTGEPLPEPITGWLAEVRAQEGKIDIDPTKPRIMLAARGRNQAEFAVDLARKRRATLFGVFVRPVRVMDLRPGTVTQIDDDTDAQEALGSTGLLAKANNVPFVPIYVTATDIAGEILDYTVTFNCDTLIMGKSRRSMFSRRFEGDVVSQVATSLPDETILITRSADTPHASRLVMPIGTEGREADDAQT
ncbi:MAG: universal stress protein [Planctomycetota bacterium]